VPEDSHALQIELVDALTAVHAASWDALGSPDDPFTTHAFLSALEAGGSVGPRTGWLPQHVLVRRQGRLVGALPLYVKGHSYGEYIFDWGWADAAQRAGIRYYPKLVSAVPFTPATGPRLLVDPSLSEVAVSEIQRALLAGAMHLADAADASSLHVLFCPEDQRQKLEELDLIGRQTHQYHWTNQGYSDFDDWLSTFRSRRRKETRRERRLPPGVQILDVAGHDLSPLQQRAVRSLYEDTCLKRGGHPYLTADSFSLLWSAPEPGSRVLLAEEGGDVVAMALLFQRGRHLYGRYWGCRPGYESLHFELCYHRPIDLCIQHGWTRFEAGAQGQHKIKRGLVPTATWSAHWLAHAGLARAVADACQREARSTARHMELLADRAPFQRGAPSGDLATPGGGR